MPVSTPVTACPCGSTLAYEHCCAPLHRGRSATDAEQLMRSRYSAFVLKLEPYLLASWHKRTRPDQLNLAAQQPEPTWLGLQVRRHISAGDQATVEYIARLRYAGGSASRLHEIAHFVREHDRWYYVDGDIQD